MKKPLTCLVASAYLATAVPYARADSNIPPSRLSSDSQSIDDRLPPNNLLASAETYSETPKADLGIAPKKRNHWWCWFYDNWTGRIVSAGILGGIGYGVYAVTAKKTPAPAPTPAATPPPTNNNNNTTTPPPPPPDPDPGDAKQ